MAKYRKKPVEVEAVQFNGSSTDISRIKLWMKGEAPIPDPKRVSTRDVKTFFIETLEGDMKVSQYDWVIKGVQGEFYPCKPDIFEETYETVDEEEEVKEIQLDEVETLVMEVLAARWRLGESFWPFDDGLIEEIRSLGAYGLLWYESDITPYNIRVHLTAKGIAFYGLNKPYEPIAKRKGF